MMILGFSPAITMRFILVFLISETNLSVSDKGESDSCYTTITVCKLPHKRIILSSSQNQGVRLFFYKNRLRLSHLHL
jgi:hypothetical protein